MRRSRDSKQRAGSSATTARLRTQRHGNQGEDKAGNGKSEALVEFHAGIAPIFAVLMPELRERALGIAEFMLCGGAQIADLRWASHCGQSR